MPLGNYGFSQRFGWLSDRFGVSWYSTYAPKLQFTHAEAASRPGLIQTIKTMVERSAIRILVLDDESFMLKLLNRVLVNAGFTDVTLFDNGQAALDRIMGMQGRDRTSSCWTLTCPSWMGSSSCGTWSA